MNTSVLTITRFRQLFAGNMSFKGVTVIKKPAEENNKTESISHLEKSPVTNKDISDHIEGIKSIGLSPINEDGLCSFGVIDIDDYTSVVKQRLQTIYRYNIPLIPFYSKSGGLHLYVFFKEPIKPDILKDTLDELKIAIGLPGDTEVFPKQRSMDKTSYASWINLPYFDAYDKDNKRKLIAEDGSIGMRITKEPFSYELCFRFQKPIVSTSANISGEPAAQNYGDISEEILSAVDYVCTSRRQEHKPHTPSSIIKLDKDGVVKVIRK